MSLLRTIPTNRSGTISSGGVAQQFAPANNGRYGFSIRNVSNKSLWFRTDGEAATMNQNSLELKTGEMYESNGNVTPIGAISIIGSQTGQAFFGEEW